MFQSSNNGINVDPVNYNYYGPFINDIATSSNSEHQFDQSFFNFPSPFNPLEDDDLFHSQSGEFLPHCQDQPPLQEINSIIVNNMAEPHKIIETNNNGNKQIGQVTRKRCSKRDRHSKINTAQGPRDRRMRLSLKVARQFFDLQDKLCFDKASKTVEWLLIQSCSAIKELAGISTMVNPSAFSTSECEVISGIQDEEAAAAIKCMSSTNNTISKAPKTAPCKRGKKAHKTALFHPRAKESREKARARARERTRNKQWMISKNTELEEANRISQFETAEESATRSHSVNRSVGEVEAQASSQLGTNESVSDESWVGSWSPLPSLSNLYNFEFPQEQNQITDFQSLCKSMWESL